MPPREIPGFRISESLHQSASTLVLRAIRESDSRPVVLKLPTERYASERQMARLELAWDVGRAIDHSNVIGFLDLIAIGRARVLVIDDFGATSLDRIPTAQLKLDRCLTIAIAIADGLSAIHEAGVIHKDIKPHNVVTHPETGATCIIDFDIASRLTREPTRAEPPSTLEGTLAYIAPEQTGRMNRSIDHRCDLYSLGVTLFELLVGRRPFGGDDPLELVHGHLARRPPLLHELDAHIPEVLSAIVDRLLAKAPEDRYQSAHGLSRDLAECRDRFRRTGRIESFPLGRHDLRSHFDVPDRLYGRQEEVAALLEAFERGAGGERVGLWVAGWSGIGKSALVGEIHRPVLARQGLFCAGKFDQFRRDLPYQALALALGGLLGDVLAEPPERREALKTRIEAAMDGQGGVISAVVPELEQLLGPQAPPIQLDPAESRNRFEHLFARFIRALTGPEHPLVLFLDDLQWADQPSLDLLQVLLSDQDTHHLVVIGAYRDNEVSETHQLTATTDALAESGFQIQHLTLRPLDQGSIEALLVDTLLSSPEEVTPLARLIVEKTRGNPFFVRELLRRLYAEGVIRFERGRWTWDLQAIDAVGISDNVAELMASRIRSFDTDVQQILKLSACIGSRFDLRTLAMAHGQSDTQTARALEPALRAELLVPLSADYKYAAWRASEGGTLHYRFQHDRVQQAAHDLLDDEARAATHLRIGRLMLQHTPGDALDERAIEVANHFLLASALITAPEERRAVAALHLSAGRRALASSAADPAARYLREGLSFLAPGAWDSDYDLTRDLHFAAAETEYLRGRDDELSRLASSILAHSRDVLDEVAILLLQLKVYTARNQFAESRACGLEALRRLGVRLPTSPTLAHVAAHLLWTKLRLASHTPEGLIQLKENHDPHIEAIASTFVWLVVPCFNSAPELMALSIMAGTRWIVAHGCTPHSANMLSCYVIILTSVDNDFLLADRYGQAALELLGRYDHPSGLCGITLVHQGQGAHWLRPALETSRELEQNWQRSVALGEHIYAGYSITVALILQVFGGRELPAVVEAYRPYHTWLHQTHHETLYPWFDSWMQLAVALTSPEKPEAGRLRGELLDIDHLLAETASARSPGVTTALIADGVYGVLWGDHERAAESLEAASRGVDELGMPPQVQAYHVFRALVHSALERTSSGQQARRHRRRARASQRTLRRWVRKGATSCVGESALIDAEIHRNAGRLPSALEGYRQALTSAREKQAPYLEALTHQGLSGVFEQLGLQDDCWSHLQQASDCFMRWGAPGLARRVLQSAPRTGQIEHQPHQRADAVTSSSLTSETLDIDTLLKASTAIASVRRLEELLARLVTLASQNAGAERCHLLLSGADGLLIEASLLEPEATPSVLLRRPYAGASIAASVVRFVEQTREPLVLDEATADPRFETDPYIASARPRSVLCLPVLNQGRLVGLLYLEHLHAVAVFTSERVTLLRTLSAQAAISIENARVYDSLEQKVEERTHQLAAATARAEAANEAKTRFFRSMTHELRTPLNGILGYARLLLDQGGISAKQHDALETIQRSGYHLLGLINDLLDMGKIEAGKFELEVGRMALSGFVEGVVSLVRPNAEVKGLRVTVSRDPELPPWIEADSKRLRQILLNLLGNAVKFTVKGGIDVRVEGADGQLCVHVQDTGPGIPHDRLDAIFELFEQAGGAGQKARGTGLGLAISRQLTQLMGGDLIATSTLGQGSTFTLRVPLRACTAPDGALPPPDLEPAPAAEPFPSEQVLPSRIELERLMALVEEGALSLIAQRAEALAETEPSLAPFALRIAALAKDFDDLGVETMLETALQGSAPHSPRSPEGP